MEVKKSGKKDIDSIAKEIQKSRDKDSKAMLKMVGSISSAIRKVGTPQVNITQKDSSKVLVNSINKRIGLLENLIKKQKSKVQQFTPESYICERVYKKIGLFHGN